MVDQGLKVPDNTIILFIEGDGTGPDIWAASVKGFDEAVQKAYNGERQIEWHEVLAGEKSFNQTGDWLPDATLEAFRADLDSPRRFSWSSAPLSREPESVFHGTRDAL